MDEIVVGDIVFFTPEAEAILRSGKLMADSGYIIPNLHKGFKVIRIDNIGSVKGRDSIHFEYERNTRIIPTWLFRQRFTKKLQTFFKDEDFLI